MKKFILIIAFGFISNSIFAQNPLKEGQTQLNAGVGISGWGVPVYFGLDYGISKDWSLGGQLSFQTDDSGYHGYHYDSSAIGIGINGNYHFNRILDIPSNFDFYAGPSLTYYIWNYDDYNDYPHPDNDALGLGLQVGGRYFFNDTFGINLEFGGNTGTSGAKFGVTFKL
ncbi:outer membrane beta-barrel protein [Flavobacterium sp. 5]|uniref:outer membrane beta-barrel protein n=1 Tax=Flavobacterium sp. 5 TaxID=2035199 RepID=UPI000C2CA0C2|nr:outer membrane beta-barrel protein [Flavobacterium sp. 5]PKB16542.1 outer membrane protein with beta-barrel domain [Flavobacterium sp. 5]